MRFDHLSELVERRARICILGVEYMPVPTVDTAHKPGATNTRGRDAGVTPTVPAPVAAPQTPEMTIWNLTVALGEVTTRLTQALALADEWDRKSHHAKSSASMALRVCAADLREAIGVTDAPSTGGSHPEPDSASRVVLPGEEGYEDAFDVCPEPTCPLYGKAVMADHRHLTGGSTPTAGKATVGNAPPGGAS